MAVNTQNTLVLRNANVVRDVVTGRMGMGFLANRQAPLSILSHPSQRYQAAHEPGRLLCADWSADDADLRAGRPERSAGIPGRRGPASSAGRAIQLGWASAEGGPALLAVWRMPCFTAKRWTSRGKALTASTRGSDS